MSLAEKLVSLRKQKGLTQMDLAELLNVSRQAISRWEVGSSVPSTENLKVLSELYEVSLDYLLSDGVEILSQSDGVQEPKNGEQTNKIDFQKRKAINLVVVSILVVLAVIISVVIAPNKKTEHITPIENMTIVEENDYTTFGFSIE